MVKPNENLGAKYDGKYDAKFGVKKNVKFGAKNDALEIVQ